MSFDDVGHLAWLEQERGPGTCPAAGRPHPGSPTPGESVDCPGTSVAVFDRRVVAVFLLGNVPQIHHCIDCGGISIVIEALRVDKSAINL